MAFAPKTLAPTAAAIAAPSPAAVPVPMAVPMAMPTAAPATELDFRPVGGGGGGYISLDSKSARVKVRGLSDPPSLVSSLVLHLDFSNTRTGWVSFVAGAGASIVGTDRNNQPPAVGEDKPKWGALIPCASPYATPGVENLPEGGITTHVMSVTSALGMGAIGEAHAAYRQALTNYPNLAGQFPAFRVASWSKSGQNWRPVLELVGFAADMDSPADLS